MTTKHEYFASTKVSILVPIYNSQAYLRECIESILHQTLRDIEIILLDDGSTDASVAMCDEYARMDSRVKVIHKPNSGYGATMNVGLCTATGEYVGFVESDDYILPDMYETLYTAAKEQMADVVKSDFRMFFGDGEDRTFQHKTISKKKEFYNKVSNTQNSPDLFKVYNINCNGIFRRLFIEENDIRFNETPGASFQDNGFYFQTMALAKRVYLLTEPFYMVRRDNPNSSVKSKSKVYCMCDEYTFIGSFLDKHTELPLTTRRMYHRIRYGNYLWNFNRIADEFKLEFLERFRQDFKAPFEQGLISAPEFNSREIDIVRRIIDSPKDFYFKNLQCKNHKDVFILIPYLFFPYYLWKLTKLRKMTALKTLGNKSEA